MMYSMVKRYCLIIFSIGFPVISYAQDDRPEFNFGVFTEADLVSNPRKVENPQEDELQIRYGANILGRYRGADGYFDLAYELTEHRFRKNSQADESTWIGASNFYYSPTRSFDLGLRHSVDQVQRDSTDADLLENTVQRTNSLATARVLAYLDRGTSLITALSFGRNGYEESDFLTNDTERVIIDTSFNRQIRRNVNYFLGLSGSQIEFIDQEGFDYQQQNSYLGLNFDYQKIQYRMQVGYSVIKFDDIETDENKNSTYDIRVKYLMDNGEFNLGSVLLFRDTSQESLSGGPNQGNQEQADIIEEQSTFLNYQHKNLCRRCTFGLTIQYDDRDYKREITNSELALNGIMRFSYRIKPSITGSLNARYEDLAFPNSPSEDYVANTVELGLSYSHSRNFNTRLRYAVEEREGGRLSDYTNRIVGLSFNYRL